MLKDYFWHLKIFYICEIPRACKNDWKESSKCNKISHWKIDWKYREEVEEEDDREEQKKNTET